jgi:hypothetical protein
MQKPGDANSDGAVNTMDITFLVELIYSGGPEPSFLPNGDPDGDCDIDCDDIDYLEAFIFQGGPAPVPCTCLEPEIDSCCFQFIGDINGDGQISVDDIPFFQNFLCYMGGASQPPVLSNADVNGDCVVDCQDYDDLVGFVSSGIPQIVDCTCREPSVDTCCCQFPGDVYRDSVIYSLDITYLTDFLFHNGPPPAVLANAYANCDSVIDSRDINYLEAYLNQGGPAPCECTCLEPEVRACQGECGDANYDEKVNLSDAVYIILFAFDGGASPQPVLACGDANSDARVGVSDAVLIINYAFSGGYSPGDCAAGDPYWQGYDCCPFEF